MFFKSSISLHSCRKRLICHRKSFLVIPEEMAAVTTGDIFSLVAFTSCWIVSIFLIKYVGDSLQNKSLGKQTSLDLIYKDTLKSNWIFVSVTFLMNALQIVFDENGIEETLAVLLYMTQGLSAHFHAISNSVNLWHRYILIFFPTALDEYSDKKVLKWSRIIRGVALLVTGGIDFIAPHNGKSATVLWMTKTSSAR